MITNLVRNIVQFGGASMFEKARLSATYKGDYYYPSESDIEAIMLTLSGKDTETRPQIGFTTILGKLETSQSKTHWNYIVKNLIILDRCLECRYFVSDIAGMDVKYVEIYSDIAQKYKNMNIDLFVRKYYQYLKKKGNLYSKKKSSFNTPKEEKKDYFKQQSDDQLFEEFNQAQILFDFILEFQTYDKLGLLKYRVNQYVYQLLLFTLFNLYYNDYILIVVLLERLLKMPLNIAKQFKIMYNQFLKNNDNLINFINVRLFIKGFNQINITEISRIDNRIISAIEDYLKIAEKSNTSSNIQEDIQLELDFDDNELIFSNAIEAVRESIHQKLTEEEYSRKGKQKLSTIIPQQNVITFEISLKEKLNKYYYKFDINCFNSFKNQTFWEFCNNYSTEYLKIDPNQFKTISLTPTRNSSQPNRNTQNDNEQFDECTTIVFQQPQEFDEKIFINFLNVTCFQIPKILENIDDFPNVEEDEFPDYVDD